MQELYQNNKDFKEYVGRYMKKHGVSLEYALSVMIVINYGKYIEVNV